MTLFRNKTQFNLFDTKDPIAVEEKKKFEQRFPWFKQGGGIRIVLSPKFDKESRVAHNRESGIRDRPASLNYQRKFTIFTDQGPVELMHCDTYRFGENKEIIGNPSDFTIKGNFNVSFDKFEFAYFLYNFPGCSNGPNYNPAVMGEVFRIEEPDKEAQEMLDIEMLITKAKNMLLFEEAEGGLTAEEITLAASAYRLPIEANGKKKTAAMLKKDILMVLKLKERKVGERAYKEFLEIIDRKEKLDDITLIQRAINNHILKNKGVAPGDDRSKGNRYWALCDEDGSVVQRFAYYQNAGSGEVDHDGPLLKELERNPELAGQIKAALKQKEASQVTA